MKDRPILFSGPMVRAILDDRKTQTRRVLRPQPDVALDYTKGRAVQRFRCVSLVPEGKKGLPEWQAEDDRGPINVFRAGRDSVQAEIGCPYGHVGDRLWVRETWTADFGDTFSDNHDAWWWEMPRSLRTQKAVQMLYYRADGSVYHAPAPEHEGYSPEVRRSTWEPTTDDMEGVKWVPGIHMPRWASRLTLEITGVRVERLQKIKESDAVAEGFRATAAEKWWQGYRDDERCGLMAQQHRGPTPPDWMVEPHMMSGRDPLAMTAVELFESTWNYLNNKRGLGWAMNPWVWALTFRRVEP